MSETLRRSRLIWLAIGLAGGLILWGIWPQSPLHAVATDRAETFAIATGFVDDGIEAIYFLDFLTGDLNALVLGRQGRGFVAMYRHNVLTDLGVDQAKNPKYLMVTGAADMRRSVGRVQLSPSVVYVAEVTTGNVAAYAIPWERSVYTAGGIIGTKPLMRLAVTPFRRAVGASVPPGS